MSVQNLEKIVGFGLSVGKTLLNASKQATTLAKITSLIPLFEEFSSLLSVDYSQLEAEVKALSPDQLDALNAYVVANFPDVAGKDKVESAIGIVIDLAKIAEKAAALWG